MKTISEDNLLKAIETKNIVKIRLLIETLENVLAYALRTMSDAEYAHFKNKYEDLNVLLGSFNENI